MSEQRHTTRLRHDDLAPGTPIRTAAGRVGYIVSYPRIDRIDVELERTWYSEAGRVTVLIKALHYRD